MGDAGERIPQVHPFSGGASVEISSDLTELGEQSVISDSQSAGHQTFSLEQTKLQQKADADAHRRYIETQRLQSEELQKSHERRKDWWIFCLVICAMSGGLLLGVVLNVIDVDPETKRWGQSLIILIIGALGGYITGSKTS